MECVSELMTPNPVVVASGTPIRRAAHILLTLGIRHLPVVGPDGRLAGVLTDYAVFREADGDRVAGDLARPCAVVAEEDDPLGGMLAGMLACRVDAIVVVSDIGHPVGIVTEHDAVRLGQGLLVPEFTAIYAASRPVLSVDRHQPATDALALMQGHAIRHVLVTDDGVVCGVLSFRDLFVADVGRILRQPADHFFTTSRVIQAVGDRSLLSMARTMVARRIGCIPIVDCAGRPVAIVTRTDVVGAVVQALENEALFPAQPSRRYSAA